MENEKLLAVHFQSRVASSAHAKAHGPEALPDNTIMS